MCSSDLGFPDWHHRMHGREFHGGLQRGLRTGDQREGERRQCQAAWLQSGKAGQGHGDHRLLLMNLSIWSEVEIALEFTS